MLFPVVVLLLVSSIMLLITRKLPIWLPYPASCMKALGLAVPTWIGASAFFSLEVWHHVFLFVLVTFKTYTSPEGTYSIPIGLQSIPIGVVFLLFAAGFLVISLIWYLLLMLVYSLCLRLLWSEVPQFLQWIKPPRRRRDILFGWAASILAVLIGAAPFLLVTFYSSDSIWNTMERKGIDTEEAIGKMFSGWYVTAVYLYHLRRLVYNPKVKDSSQVNSQI